MRKGVCVRVRGDFIGALFQSSVFIANLGASLKALALDNNIGQLAS